MSSEIDNAYAAGLFDGEGSVTLSKQSKTAKFRHVHVNLASTTFELLSWLHVTFSGRICYKAAQPEHPKWKPSGQWAVSNDSAIRFLATIHPYVKEPKKLRRIEHILNNYKNVTVRNGQYTPEAVERKLTFEREFFEL